jgi:hypothetical protein
MHPSHALQLGDAARVRLPDVHGRAADRLAIAGHFAAHQDWHAAGPFPRDRGGRHEPLQLMTLINVKPLEKRLLAVRMLNDPLASLPDPGQ